MRSLVLLSVVLWLAVPVAGATDFESVGYSEETWIVGPGADDCAGGSLVHHHDGDFENGYAWRNMGVQAPYYGAFGEGYDLGAGWIYCGAYWLTQIGNFYDQTADCYVWQGGTDTPPDAVLAVVTGIVFSNVPGWPAVGESDVDLNVGVAGPFTVGYWGNWPGHGEAYFCAADLDGTRGYPWTCIAPVIGYPTGWSDPSIAWGPTRSLGCGAYFLEGGTAAESDTWGAVKALFRR